MRQILSRFGVPVIVLVLLGLCITFALSLKNAQGVDIADKIGLDQRLGNRLPMDAAFRDETGNHVKLGDYFGKRPVLLMLVFFSCQGSCQLEFENAAQTLTDIKNQSAGKDFDVISLSIDPKETPELAAGKKADVLNHYTRTGAYDGWHFLTGNLDQIKRVAGAIGYRFYINPTKNQILHPTGLFVVTPDGRLSRYLYGVDYVASMVSDSVNTAARGKINVPSDPILFGCIQFDPTNGKTRVDVFRALQVGGFLTIFALAGLIFMLIKSTPKGPVHPSQEVQVKRSA